MSGSPKSKDSIGDLQIGDYLLPNMLYELDSSGRKFRKGIYGGIFGSASKGWSELGLSGWVLRVETIHRALPVSIPTGAILGSFYRYG